MVLKPPPLVLGNSQSNGSGGMTQLPNQTYSGGTAAQINALGNCAAARQGQVVVVTDDTTAEGTCAGTTTLTGGSTFFWQRGHQSR